MCFFYCNCNYCAKRDDCPYDLMGDGTAFCREFACNVDECKQINCISFEEELFT